MSNMISKEVQLAARPDGEPKDSDFQIAEVPVVAPGAGEF
ncbi:MAG TPA: NADP-dependent oxidoreductase, partial [Rhodobiaceae bacterium]|nr:NADP-dependent oxidoreductase [Rhodobiaceae bacterium]